MLMILRKHHGAGYTRQRLPRRAELVMVMVMVMMMVMVMIMAMVMVIVMERMKCLRNKICL